MGLSFSIKTNPLWKKIKSEKTNQIWRKKSNLKKTNLKKNRKNKFWKKRSEQKKNPGSASGLECVSAWDTGELE